ncbi:hypothetical protein [Flammeovirga agarivorans]|uniref:Uncharacterized protein n=1 Tax=Flammeovirga agarivorans TaxID=2726742 RepID=A0A7X8SR57_9BACT|nr:hypothetical protein [Flammeovirga agarivorans]NLR94873.1 hypothetical protein [Flammeovirga agarivorans]
MVTTVKSHYRKSASGKMSVVKSHKRSKKSLKERAKGMYTKAKGAVGKAGAFAGKHKRKIAGGIGAAAALGAAAYGANKRYGLSGKALSSAFSAKAAGKGRFGTAVSAAKGAGRGLTKGIAGDVKSGYGKVRGAARGAKLSYLKKKRASRNKK